MDLRLHTTTTTYNNPVNVLFFAYKSYSPSILEDRSSLIRSIPGYGPPPGPWRGDTLPTSSGGDVAVISGPW